MDFHNTIDYGVCMGKIEYRHYQKGDEEQLADLFNRAFQMNGGGFVRTPKIWKWRYVQSPGFEPEQCQLAEDRDTGKIVGAIYVNLVERIPLGNQRVLVGDINDVSCHPDYTGQGIATELMKMAIKFMKNKGCDISMLTADYNGFPRKNTYLKYGYKDIDRQIVFINFPQPLNLIKNLIGFSILFPVLFILSFIPRLISRLRVKLNHSTKNLSYKIAHNQDHSEYREAVNRIMPLNYEGFPKYDNEKFKWARLKAPLKQHIPSYIFIKMGNKIIGGASLTHQNLYSFRFGVKMRIGILHELFLNQRFFPTKKDLYLGYVYLVDKVMKAATKRNIGGFFLMIDSQNLSLQKALRTMGFLKFKGGAVMVKSFNKKLDLTKIKKPIFVPTYVSTGIP